MTVRRMGCLSFPLVGQVKVLELAIPEVAAPSSTPQLLKRPSRTRRMTVTLAQCALAARRR